MTKKTTAEAPSFATLLNKRTMEKKPKKKHKMKINQMSFNSINKHNYL